MTVQRAAAGWAMTAAWCLSSSHRRWERGGGGEEWASTRWFGPYWNSTFDFPHMLLRFTRQTSRGQSDYTCTYKLWFFCARTHTPPRSDIYSWVPQRLVIYVERDHDEGSAAGGCITLFIRATQWHYHFMDYLKPNSQACTRTQSQTHYICLSIFLFFTHSLLAALCFVKCLPTAFPFPPFSHGCTPTIWTLVGHNEGTTLLSSGMSELHNWWFMLFCSSLITTTKKTLVNKKYKIIIWTEKWNENWYA